MKHVDWHIHRNYLWLCLHFVQRMSETYFDFVGSAESELHSFILLHFISWHPLPILPSSADTLSNLSPGAPLPPSALFYLVIATPLSFVFITPVQSSVLHKRHKGELMVLNSLKWSLFGRLKYCDHYIQKDTSLVFTISTVRGLSIPCFNLREIQVFYAPYVSFNSGSTVKFCRKKQQFTPYGWSVSQTLYERYFVLPLKPVTDFTKMFLWKDVVPSFKYVTGQRLIHPLTNYNC
jgi:hypothetical protein